MVVAPFTSHVKDSTFLETLSKRFGARAALLWVFADPEVLARRQRRRNADRDTSVKVTLPQPPLCPHVLVDTSSVQEADMKATAVDAVTRAFSTKKGRVLCAGHVCVDVVLEGCGELGSREGYCEVASTRLAAGGSVANCASTLASLETYGVDAHCCVGDDAFGRFLLDYFRQHSVGTTHINVNEKHPSSRPAYRSTGRTASAPSTVRRAGTPILFP